MEEGRLPKRSLPFLFVSPKKRINTKKSVPVFTHCVELELALVELLGPNDKWTGLAGAFQNHRRVRSAVLDAVRIIRKRLTSILTADDRLRLTTDVHLDGIERLAKLLRSDGRGILPLLANFIHLTAVLLGYDWLVGRVNREVIYYQTLAQQIADDEARHPNSNFQMGKIEYDYRVVLTKDLHAKGMRVAQIGRILNQPESFIKNILVREGVITRRANIKQT